MVVFFRALVFSGQLDRFSNTHVTLNRDMISQIYGLMQAIHRKNNCTVFTICFPEMARGIKVRFQCNCYGQWNKYRKIKISNFASSAEALIYCESIIIYAFRIDYVTKNVNQSNKIQIWHICIVRMRKCYFLEKSNFFDLILQHRKLSDVIY